MNHQEKKEINKRIDLIRKGIKEGKLNPEKEYNALELEKDGIEDSLPWLRESAKKQLSCLIARLKKDREKDNSLSL